MESNRSKTPDLFSIVHFLLWFLFGTILPGQYLLALVVSILFEWVESSLIWNQQLYDLFSKYWIIPERYWNETIENKILDIVLNMTGYVLGSLFVVSNI